MVSETKNYASTTQQPQTKDNQCPFSFTIVCISSRNYYKLDTKLLNLSQIFITTNSGRWILLPLPASKCNCIRKK